MTVVGIAGLGARTPLGLTGPSSVAAVRGGLAGFDEHPYMVRLDGENMVVALAPYLPADADFLERCRLLAGPAALEALSTLGSPPLEQELPVLLAAPEPRPGLPAQWESRLKEVLEEALARYGPQITLFAQGNAGGALALEAGMRLIRDGAPYCLVGGVDSYIDVDTLEWLDSQNLLHGGDNAWGFIPGEGAGFCLLSRAEASSNPVQILAAGTAMEPVRPGGDDVCLGRGLSQAFELTLNGLPNQAKVGSMICDMNGESWRADEFGFTMNRLGRLFADPDNFRAPADCWGQTGAASIPLFLVLATLNNRSPENAPALIWAASENGLRGAALISHPETQGGHHGRYH